MMAEEESEAVRCLAQMSDENAQILELEKSSSPQESQGTNAMPTDHDYVEGASEKQQHECSKLDIVISPPVPTGLVVAVPSSSPLSPLQNNPKDESDDVQTLIMKYGKPWNKIGTWTSPYKGYFSTNKELEQAIKTYTEATDSRWVVSAKDKLFGSDDIKLSNFKLFWRGREDNRKAAFPDFDGIPFIMIGRKTWGCHLGRDKCRSGKIKYRTKMQEENEEGKTDKWPITRSSKKLGCPALISGVHVLKFHEYPITLTMSEFHRKQLLKRLRQSLLSKHSIVKAEQRFYITLAHLDEHIHDSANALQDSTSPSVKVDRNVIYKITELHHSGMFRLAEVNRVLDYYRKQLCKDSEPPPPDLIPELYPSHNVMHYFISHAVKVTSLLELDLGRGHQLVSGWQSAYPNDSWYYQPFASSGPIKRAKNKGDRLLVCHYPDLTQTFLFCCQNAAQRRLLNTYGTVCVLDSPQGRTVLPTYFLHVRTNTGYQVVCTVVMQYWNCHALVEALQVVKDWNPEWQPQAMLMDLIEEEIEALEKLFPECNILISFVHRERAWLDYLNATEEEEDQGADSALLDSLVYAQNEEQVDATLEKLQESPLWTENYRLQHWMTIRWLPYIRKWSFAFFSKHLLVTLFANRGLDRLREALVYDWLDGVRSRTLSELLTSLILDELPKLYDSYREENRTMATSNRYQCCPMLPVYVRHQPVPAREHINEVISTLPPMSVTKTGQGKFLVRQDDDGLEHSVSFGDEYEYPACDCWAWLTRMEICQHFGAVFSDRECADWHWCQLSPLYTGHPIFALDLALLEVVPREVPRCGDVAASVAADDEPKDSLPVTMDDFGAEEVLENDSDGDEDDGGIEGTTWQLDRKQTTCKSLLDQLGQLTEQTRDPEAMDYMTNNLVLLLRQMQGKRNETPSPNRKRLRSGSPR